MSATFPTRRVARRDGFPAPCLVETVRQRASRLGVSELTVWRQLRRGDTPAFRIGGTWRLPAPERDLLDDLPCWCTVRQVANSLAVSELTVRRWIAAAELPAMKIGRSWTIPRHHLELLLATQGVLLSGVTMASTPTTAIASWWPGW
jgi:excisionase family DNA binding protein